MNEQITVIVPIYKTEAFLARCIESILAQTWRNFVLLLLNDGSPDGCGAICDDYAAKDSRIRVIHQENQGVAVARNVGISWFLANSESQWMVFVDSDDWVEPDYLEILYRGAAETGCLLSTCSCYRTWGEPIPDRSRKPSWVMEAEDYYCAAGLLGPTMQPVAKLYHKSLVEGLHYPEGKIHEDEFLTLHIVFRTKQIAVTNAKLYAYYYNPDSITSGPWTPSRLDQIEGIQQQIEYARKYGLKKLENYAISIYLGGMGDQISQLKGRREYRQYRRELKKRLIAELRRYRENGKFPLTKDNRWAYVPAYPLKPVRWIIYLCYGKGGRS